MHRMVVVCLLILCSATAVQAQVDSAEASVSTCSMAMRSARVYRGSELPSSNAAAVESEFGPVLQNRGLRVALERSARVETTAGIATTYLLEAASGDHLSAPAGEPTPVALIEREGVDGDVVRLVVAVAFSEGEAVSLSFRDTVSGDVTAFDVQTQAVSCTSTNSCEQNCALQMLCNDLSKCEKAILIAKLAACVSGSVVSCASVAEQLAEFAICMGVNCKSQCSSSKNCAHSPCVQGAKLSKNCSSCVTKVCDTDSHCCNNNWDAKCVKLATSKCGSTCK